MSHYMTADERYHLEALYNIAHMSVAQIAKEMGFCTQTIYNELKRGRYSHTIELREEVRYSAEKAGGLHRAAQSGKGRPEKIGKEHDYAKFIEKRIVKDKYSPAAAIAAAKAEGFSFSICVTTLYSYIDKGLFMTLSNKHLWEKSRRKKHKTKERRISHPQWPSITKRPDSINQRTELGHWEMDLIIGKKHGSALLTLIERKSRRELIFKLPNKKADSIQAVFDKIEKTTPNFKNAFKSITTDNGAEFLQYETLTKSIYGGKRFEMYYCHSYAAWEKGSNENHNRMIRRFFPKGTDFSKVNKKRIEAIQKWMNNYPRKVLNWSTPEEVYYSQMNQILQQRDNLCCGA